MSSLREIAKCQSTFHIKLSKSILLGILPTYVPLKQITGTCPHNCIFWELTRNPASLFSPAAPEQGEIKFSTFLNPPAVPDLADGAGAHAGVHVGGTLHQHLEHGEWQAPVNCSWGFYRFYIVYNKY